MVFVFEISAHVCVDYYALDYAIRSDILKGT